MRFTLRQLQLFVAACETGTVTGAAEREFISQSAVSAAIAGLERALGVQLLIRHHAQGVTPSPAGRQFLQEARALLHQAAELDRLATALTEEVAGRLDLGSLVTLAPLVIPRLGLEFRRRYPAAEINLVEAGQDGLLRLLADGAIALAVTYDLQIPDGVAFERLAALPPHALLPADHPLAAAPEVDLAELAPEPFVLLDLPLSNAYFRSLFLARGLEPNVQHRSPHLETIRSLVANGYGYSLVNARPPLDRALDGRPLVAVPLAGAPHPLHLGLAALAGTREPRLVRAFRAHCRELAAAGAIPGVPRLVHPG